MSTFRTPPVFCLFDGNSIGNYPTLADSYPTQMLASTGYVGRNVAISGAAWASLGASPLANPPFRRRASIFLNGGQATAYLMVGGIQDVQNGLTAAQVYTVHKNQADLARSYNPGLLIIDSTITPYSSLPGAQETVRVDANALIMADVDNKFDAQVDLSALMPDPNNATYYGDGLHPTVAGAAVIAAAMAAAVDALT